MRSYLSILLIAFAGYAAAAEPFDIVESDVFSIDGTAVELTNKAKVCIGKLVKNDIASDQDIEKKFSFISPDKLVITSKIEYTYLLLGHAIQSKLTFEAREGRFKLTNTDIGHKLIKSIGLLSGGGQAEPDTASFTPVTKSPISGWEEMANQITTLNNKIAECVDKESW